VSTVAVPFRRVLVANRGEIARRVFRTCRSMGLSTVAVYSDSDAGSLHVQDADVAVALGGVTAAESYLDIAKVIDAAERSGADAIHPGYGFLSENADFARAVLDTGLAWVGPPPEAMDAMARKIEAKATVAAAGVPLVPGAELAGDDEAAWAGAAAEVGYPLLVKASAGGGGKGMRRVDRASDLADAVRGARREAASSFGDPTVFVERCLLRARHVEVQVFGDHHGTIVHLGERDCSVQRRHQKVLEEAPAPQLGEGLRSALHEGAVAAARAIGYVNAGTVEFLVDGHDFYFLEMNTRLQVEHPVTEAVWGLDLVRLQLVVAAGAALHSVLANVQPSIRREPHGHAVEARLYAEDPANDYLPSTGTLITFDPPDVASVRWDLGVASGSGVSPWFDPMLGKVIAHAPNRREATLLLARALRGLRVHGITTNRDQLVAVLESEPFLDGDVHTGLLDEHPQLSTPSPPAPVRTRHLAAAAMALRAERAGRSPLAATVPPGWRNVTNQPQEVRFVVAGEERAVHYQDHRDGSTELTVDEEPVAVEVHTASAELVDLAADGLRAQHRVHLDTERVWVNDAAWQTELAVVPRFTDADATLAGRGPTAPVPGTVTDVLVNAGDAVEAGATLVLLEAMKMEHRITAPSPGTVARVLVVAGDRVDAHQLLVEIDTAEAP
jgi:acetyl/propionyl-CoA carboxylase alpha subunit